MSDEKDPFAKPPASWIESPHQRALQRHIEREQQNSMESLWRLLRGNGFFEQKRQEAAPHDPAKPTIARRDPAREAIILAIDILRNELGREPHRSEVYAFLADGRDPEGDITKSDPHIGLRWVNSKGEPKLMTKKRFNARYKMLTKDD